MAVQLATRREIRTTHNDYLQVNTNSDEIASIRLKFNRKNSESQHKAV